MASNVTASNKPLDTYAQWGVPSGPALWPVVLRILIVVDGRISTSTCTDFFGLGYVLETLRDPTFASWVPFKVQVVRRDAVPQGNPQDCIVADTNYSEGGDPAFVTNFRFTDPRFNIDDWDEIWFFGDYPSNLPGFITDPTFQPMGDLELKLIAEWMDRGGGVFAAGDHWNLGAPMCSRIPRVRTMRRWTEAQGVPTMGGIDRHETLQQATTEGSEDQLESDAIPQPVELVYRSWVASVLVRPTFTHPLLSTPTGVIDQFPDHMHEGDVVNDHLVELDLPLDIPLYERPEYPFAEPQIDPRTAARDTSGVTPLQLRPRPHVVAYGRTTNISKNLPRLAGASGEMSPPLLSKRFGLVGAYDGDSVGIGRVVVDSSWHHWFTWNLGGFKTRNTPVYENMKTYYRNVALWLARLAQRQAMVVATTWGPVVSDPTSFAPSRGLWEVGKKAADVISHTVPRSMLFDFVGSFFHGRVDEIFGVPSDIDPASPYTGSVPADLAVRAIVGGIASSLVQPATEYLESKGRPRRLLDPDAIARHAASGVREGYLALINTIQSAASASRVIVGRLESTFRPLPLGPIAVNLVQLRVIAERLQFPDPTDPVFADSHRTRGQDVTPSLTLTVRVALAGSVVAHAVISEVKVPSFGFGGAFVNLDRVLYEGLVQSGETLTVDVVTGASGPEQVDAERVRFNETISDDPSSWVGRHTPSRSQPWRLWYRIEKIGNSGAR